MRGDELREAARRERVRRIVRLARRDVQALGLLGALGRAVALDPETLELLLELDDALLLLLERVLGLVPQRAQLVVALLGGAERGRGALERREPVGRARLVLGELLARPRVLALEDARARLERRELIDVLAELALVLAGAALQRGELGEDLRVRRLGGRGALGRLGVALVGGAAHRGVVRDRLLEVGELRREGLARREGVGELGLERGGALTLEFGEVGRRGRLEGGELGAVVGGFLQRGEAGVVGALEALVERRDLLSHGGLCERNESVQQQGAQEHDLEAQRPEDRTRGARLPRTFALASSPFMPSTTSLTLRSRSSSSPSLAPTLLSASRSSSPPSPPCGTSTNPCCSARRSASRSHASRRSRRASCSACCGDELEVGAEDGAARCPSWPGGSARSAGLSSLSPSAAPPSTLPPCGTCCPLTELDAGAR